MPTTAAAALSRLALASLLALLLVLGGTALGPSASAQPGDDTVAVDDDLVVDPADPTETPLPEPETELTPVAIPSVSPEPTQDPLDVTGVGDLPLDASDPGGQADLVVGAERCDPIVPGRIDDISCSPAPSEGYDGYIYLHPSENVYEITYQGPFPTSLLDLPTGRYMVSAGPVPLLMQLKMICTEEDQAGALLQTLTGTQFVVLHLRAELVYRCTVYTLPEGELPDEMAPDLPTDGPVELVITDILCPPGTDPALNYFGLIGRCGERSDDPRYIAHTAAGATEEAYQIGPGQVSLALSGGAWTVSLRPNVDHPVVLFCNVRDELGQEPARYAPFMTYTYGPDGAEMLLEQGMTWLCFAYHIPTTMGTGADVAQITVMTHACPVGTQAPTVATCGDPLSGVTFHLLYGTETIVATRATDGNGSVAFAAPENLSVFGLAQVAPAGHVSAGFARCSENGGAPTDYPVSATGVIDLGTLAGGDTVACDWFDIVDPASTSIAAGPEVVEPVEPQELGPIATPIPEPQNDSSGDAPRDDSGEDAAPTETPASGMIPLEEGE